MVCFLKWWILVLSDFAPCFPFCCFVYLLTMQQAYKQVTL